MLRLHRVAMRIAGLTPVTMYRGMTEVKKVDLEKIIGEPPGKEGVVEMDEPVPSKDAQWWATSLGVAKAYATTDPAGGPKVGTRYDVLMIGELPEKKEKPTSGMGVVDLSKEEVPLHVTHVLYALREGTAKERKARMERLLEEATGTAKAA